MVPPDSIPNSEVKRSDADGSVGFPHVRVGHHQGFIGPLASTRLSTVQGVFVLGKGKRKAEKQYLLVLYKAKCGW